MKFLIFNIIVFFSLGYLLTSKPNENFNEWVGNTKNKISQISKNEIISTIKKATSKKTDQEILNNPMNIKGNNVEKNKIVKEAMSNINVDENPEMPENKESNKIQKKEVVKEVVSNINKQESSKYIENKKFDIQKIINQVLAEKKANELNIKKIVKDNSKTIINSNEINKVEVKEDRETQEKNKFMSIIQRENALADLIIDMELYHLNTLKE